jgi:transposase
MKSSDVAKRFPFVYYRSMGKTATEAAKVIGCSIATVSRWADRLNLGTKYGNALVLSNSDIRKISKERRKHAGNPNFICKK